MKIALLTLAIKYNSNDANAYYNRWNTYLRKREYDKAILDYNKAIELNPNHVSSYKNIWIVYSDYKIDRKKASIYLFIAYKLWLNDQLKRAKKDWRNKIPTNEKRKILEEDKNSEIYKEFEKIAGQDGRTWDTADKLWEDF